MSTEVTTQTIERPSGSYVSVKNDGFEIQSNVGTEDEIRAELGLTKPAPTAPPAEDAAQPPASPGSADNASASLPSVAKPSRPVTGRRGRQIEAQIEADLERKRLAKAEADAEEARLTELREERAKLAQPPNPASAARPVAAPASTPAQPPIAPNNGVPAATPAAQPAFYDGADPKDPEPTLEMFKELPDPYSARADARMEWAARKAERRTWHQSRMVAQHQHEETVYGTRLKAFNERLVAADTANPNWRKSIDPEVATALEWAVPSTFNQQTGQLEPHWGTPLGNLVFDSPNPDQFLVYFSSNKQDFQRLLALQPAEQLLAFGELRERFRSAARSTSTGPAAKPKLVSQAKPPAPPVGGMAPAAAEDRPDDELSEEEHDAKYGPMRRRFR